MHFFIIGINTYSFSIVLKCEFYLNLSTKNINYQFIKIKVFLKFISNTIKSLF